MHLTQARDTHISLTNLIIRSGFKQIIPIKTNDLTPHFQCNNTRLFLRFILWG